MWRVSCGTYGKVHSLRTPRSRFLGGARVHCVLMGSRALGLWLPCPDSQQTRGAVWSCTFLNRVWLLQSTWHLRDPVSMLCALSPYRFPVNTPLSGLSSWLSSKECSCEPEDAGDATGLISGSGRSPEGGNDNPLQYPCLENPMDRGAWPRLQSLGSQRVGHD